MADLSFMRLALECANENCVPVITAFCVGCVITIPRPHNSTSDNTKSNASSSSSLSQPPIVLSTGYSRELDGNTHAEANALAKARNFTPSDIRTLLQVGEDNSDLPSIDQLLQTADVYTTLEPCSIRTSGLAPCADALIAARIKRCIIGVGEPADFVQCEGARKLETAGIEVIWMDGLEKDCLAVARKGHPPPRTVRPASSTSHYVVLSLQFSYPPPFLLCCTYRRQLRNSEPVTAVLHHIIGFVCKRALSVPKNTEGNIKEEVSTTNM